MDAAQHLTDHSTSWRQVLAAWTLALSSFGLLLAVSIVVS
jgi:hypothetical protein